MLEDLLREFLSNENSLRIEAEREFTKRKETTPRDVIMGLAEITSNPHADIRCLSIVLLRGITVRDQQMWAQVPESEIKQIRDFFLQRLQHEPLQYVRRKLIDCIAAIARLGDWPDLFSLIVQLIDGAAEHILTSLELVEKLGEYVGENLVAHTEGLLSIIRPCLLSENINVRIHAARALMSLAFDLKEVLADQPPPESAFYHPSNPTQLPLFLCSDGRNCAS